MSCTTKYLSFLCLAPRFPNLSHHKGPTGSHWSLLPKEAPAGSRDCEGNQGGAHATEKKEVGGPEMDVCWLNFGRIFGEYL